jgi:hypothetical protein
MTFPFLAYSVTMTNDQLAFFSTIMSVANSRQLVKMTNSQSFEVLSHNTV